MITTVFRVDVIGYTTKLFVDKASACDFIISVMGDIVNKGKLGSEAFAACVLGLNKWRNNNSGSYSSNLFTIRTSYLTENQGRIFDMLWNAKSREGWVALETIERNIPHRDVLAVSMAFKKKDWIVETTQDLLDGRKLKFIRIDPCRLIKED